MYRKMRVKSRRSTSVFTKPCKCTQTLSEKGMSPPSPILLFFFKNQSLSTRNCARISVSLVKPFNYRCENCVPFFDSFQAHLNRNDITLWQLARLVDRDT